MNKFLFLAFSIFAFPVCSAHAIDLGLNASSLQIRVYKMAVSSNPLCTNPITVVNNGSSPQAVDLINNPTIGSGSLTDGTYPCVIIELSDQVQFAPDVNSDSGHCSTAGTYTLDVCASGTSELVDGSTVNCTGANDHIAMYLSTASTSTTASDAFNPPTSLNDAAHGFNLANALSVSGSSVGKFIVNPDGKVCDDAAVGCDSGGGGGTSCKMEPPLFSFSQL